MFIEVDGYLINADNIESISPLWGKNNDQTFVIKFTSGKEHRFYQDQHYNAPDMSDIYNKLKKDLLPWPHPSRPGVTGKHA